MENYRITEKAGRRVAGVSNTGVGKIVSLTEEQAAAAVKAGELVVAASPAEEAAASEVSDLSKLNKAELLGLARELGADVDEKQTKAEIIAAIASHGGKPAGA